jgi:signal transduction histidine kinase
MAAHQAPSIQFTVRMELQNEVLQKWIHAVRAQVSRAQEVATPVLIDTLPMFYKHLASLGAENFDAYDESTLALEHGGERARMTSIDVHGLIHEFQLLRAVLFGVWGKAGIVVGHSELGRINAAIDDAIRDSISGFIAKETSYREEFFAALTHDLRTPLGTASMAIDLIERTGSVERTNDLIRVVRKQHTLMGQMITDLLDTMSLKAGQEGRLDMAEVELASLAKDVIRDAELAANLSIQFEGPNVVGHWCRKSLRRAIENLVNNALKYGEKDSPVKVLIEKVDGRVALSVTNFGVQIPHEQIEGLFKMFRRGEQHAAFGTSSWGIGLSYVRSVAERHGGSVIVASNASQTTFVLNIPLDPRPLLLSHLNGRP